MPPFCTGLFRPSKTRGVGSSRHSDDGGGSGSSSSSSSSNTVNVQGTASKSQHSRMTRLQRLAQPFLLPVSAGSGWLFFWLFVSLLFVVAASLAVFLTAIVYATFAASPDFAEVLFSGALALVQGFWTGAWGTAVVGSAVLGVASFALCRHRLRGRWCQWIMIGLIVLVLFCMNGVNTAIGFLANLLVQAMIERDESTFYTWLLVYASFFILALPVLTFQFWLEQRLGLHWREWLTTGLIDSWMSNRAYYVLNSNDETAENSVDNPDQRISQDVLNFTMTSLEYFVGVVNALIAFCLNILVLISINGILTATLLSWSISMTVLILIFSRQLVKVNYSQQKYEADFRYSLVHVRDNAESIAFYGGEAAEKKEAHNRLRGVVRNFGQLIRWNVGISVLTRMHSSGSVFIPFLVMGPLILSGELTYGDFTQAAITFGLVENSLAFIARRIEGLTAWAAGVSRLEGFQSAVRDLEELQAVCVAAELAPQGRDPEIAALPIVLSDVELRAPGSEQVLVRGLSMSLEHGQRVLLVGPSGCGKTSLLRVISGLWRPSRGQVETFPVGSLLFVPQKPYMLLGSLREQLSYPNEDVAFSDERLREVLGEVSLGHLVERYPNLGVKQDWARLLSLGEQQRLSFARVLLSAPRCVILDESTSALDVQLERRLYTLLRQRGVAFMSVGHRPTLVEHHETVLQLAGAPDGSWKLLPAADYDFNTA